MKLLFIAIVAIHGLIHLIGVVKEFNLRDVSQLSRPVVVQRHKHLRRLIGILWLSACLFFLAAIVGLLTNNIWWLIPAIAAIVVSQSLIILYWHDAKWGSVLNTIILVMVIISIAEWNSLRNLSSQLKELFSH